MLISDIKGWTYVVSWDNAKTPNSKTMIDALEALGNLTGVETATTYMLSPKSTTTEAQVKAEMQANLDSTKGNAVLANLQDRTFWECGQNTGLQWQQVH